MSTNMSIPQGTAPCYTCGKVAVLIATQDDLWVVCKCGAIAPAVINAIARGRYGSPCSSCKGKGYRMGQEEVQRPDTGKWVDIETRRTCKTCNGEGIGK